MRGETERQDVRHQWRREDQDQHKAHETRLWQVNVHVVFLLVRVVVTLELSIPSNFLLLLFSINLQQLLLPFYFHEDK